jgi:hypothetical protein
MESWLLLLMLNFGGETVPARVPMSSYERCMEAGHHAETLMSKHKDVKLTWTCQSSKGG